MSENEYLDTIVAESRGFATEEQKQRLEGDKQSWREGLVTLLDQANSSLGYLQRDFQEKTEERLPISEYRRLQTEMTSRRAKTIHFKRSIEKRLREVNLMLSEERKVAGKSMDDMRELLDTLLNLIELDGIHNDVPQHLHYLLNQRLERLMVTV